MTRPSTGLHPSLFWLSAAALWLTAAGGCPGSPPAPPAPSQTETPPGGPVTDEAPPPSPSAAPADAAADEPEDTAAPPADEPAPSAAAVDAAVSDEAVSDTAGQVVAKASDRDALAAAYVALYCAQRRGEATRLRALYAEHGFADPRAWRVAWEAASEDRAWLADVTQRAIAACP